MKVVILEDEKLAADHLQNILKSYDKDIIVEKQIDSVKNAIIWFLKNPAPDVIFMDIQLGDGLSFEILDAVDINCPIIFTTAFDEYALKAFKVNSIDYILKPVEKEDLVNAFKKISKLNINLDHAKKEDIRKASDMLSSKYKERFIVKIGDHIHSIQSMEILFFVSEHKATFARSKDNKKYLIDYPLDRIEMMLNPNTFFRINRKYIIAFESIEDIVQYSNSRLRVKLKHSDDTDVIVSRDRVGDFRQWLDK